MAERSTAGWVTREEGTPVRLERGRYRIEVVRGPDKGLRSDFDAAVARVGARPVCDLVLSDTAVSGTHLEIRPTEVGFLLRDLRSTNGTFVDGVRVLEALAETEARIRVGSSELRLRALGDRVEVPLHPEGRFGPLLGTSAAMRALFADLGRIGPSDATVLVEGETGTGKELVAEAIHGSSRRAAGPFVVVDCGALPGSLVESELFGHERGAFTGAASTFRGAFERADRGTVFLDEVGELPLDLQPKLLRVIERREVRRIGAEHGRTVDVRIIAATNRVLEREVNRGSFREDLFFRLAVLRVEVPPLRDRIEDAVLLARSFALDLGARLSEEELAQLEGHGWPGNVRELKNAVERWAIMGPRALGSPRLPAGDPMTAETPRTPEAAPGEMRIDPDEPFRAAKARLVETFERRYVEAALARAGGNVAKAARRSGVDRMTFYKLLARLGIRPDRT